MKRLLLVLLFAVPVWAQTPVTVTATITTPTGTLATSGTVQFKVQPYSASILYYILNTGVLAPAQSTCGINASGVLLNTTLSGPCLVWGNDVITPGNTTYDVTFNPNGVYDRVIHQISITGAGPYNLAAPVFAPPVQVIPQYVAIRTPPYAANLLPAADTVFNVGAPNLRYANGYFTTLTATNMSFTNLDVTGNFTFNALISRSANPAVQGALRLAYFDLIDWRNAANGGDNALEQVAAHGNIPANTLLYNAWTGGILASMNGFGSNSSTTATAGLYRLASLEKICWRDSIDSTNLCASKDASDNFIWPNGLSLGGGTALATTNQSGTGNLCMTTNCALASPTTTGTDNGAETLVNKTLTSPVVNGTPIGTGVATLTLKKGSGGGNYTSASTTYVVVDSTNLCYTVTIPTGWKLSVVARGNIGTSTAVVAASAAITDNGACATANSGVLVEGQTFGNAAGNTEPFSLGWIITGDGNSHNVALQFKTANGADSALILNSSSTLLPTMTFTLVPSN